MTEPSSRPFTTADVPLIEDCGRAPYAGGASSRCTAALRRSSRSMHSHMPSMTASARASASYSWRVRVASISGRSTTRLSERSSRKPGQTIGFRWKRDGSSRFLGAQTQALHRTIASTLERESEPELLLEKLAYHWWAAHDDVRSAGYIRVPATPRPPCTHTKTRSLATNEPSNFRPSTHALAQVSGIAWLFASFSFPDEAVVHLESVASETFHVSDIALRYHNVAAWVAMTFGDVETFEREFELWLEAARSSDLVGAVASARFSGAACFATLGLHEQFLNVTSRSNSPASNATSRPSRARSRILQSHITILAISNVP